MVVLAFLIFTFLSLKVQVISSFFRSAQDAEIESDRIIQIDFIRNEFRLNFFTHQK